ncbi:mrna splicing factor rna helicase [Stylonychia lemnae]|uniref:RNA helicase n=1 Tax=Stylonychia lemnae TaxID=5949 RepID=A0A078B4X2_STYLE|nr:mrna splicing factor rna helicase [Stylonychia lemnae]|eukprot:CDW88583.1 mrna splicing factor rna helicase [Stylonychia lemnae]
MKNIKLNQQEKKGDNPNPIENDVKEDEEGAFIAFNKNELFKTLPVEEKGNYLICNQLIALEILYTVEKNNTTIVVGETGSGKSTKLPQFLYQAGYCKDGKMICVTLPKRVSVLNIASRLAFNMSSNLGDEVGYSIRFDAKFTENTKIKVVTDGMLLREMLIDPLLSKYSVLMIDDCHERSIYTDIILGLLKKIRRKRQNDLKIIISSATIEAQMFWRFFHEPPEFKAQIIEVEGRQYPVEILYLEKSCKDYVAQAVQTAITIHMREELNSGDVLVFLTGQDEINMFIEQFNLAAQCIYYQSYVSIEKKLSHSVFCLPCYANLPMDKQMKIFEPTPINKNLESLVVIPASKSSCDQRAGRSGRVAAGKCFRLCTKEEYERYLPEQMKPEIQRSDTSHLILQLKALGIRNLLTFDYLSPPSKENFIRSLEVLYSLGAIDDTAQLTQDIGMKLVEMPIDPRMAAAILNSNKEEWRVTEEVLSVAALLQVQNLFVTVKDPTIIQKAKKKYGVIEGDHISLLNIFNIYNSKKSDNEKKGFCREVYVNEKSLKKAVQIKQQLRGYLKMLNVKVLKSDDYDDPEAILKSLITGYFANVAQRQVDGTYRNVRSMTDVLVIHPSSVLANIRPKWILYNEIVVTSKKFMREVSEVKVEWLTELAPHFYVDKRKQILEEQHKRESIRNLEHDYKGKQQNTGQNQLPAQNEKSITSHLQKQQNRFRKGMNFSMIESDPTNKEDIQPQSYSNSSVTSLAAEPKSFKRQKIEDNKTDGKSKAATNKKPTIGLSFQDEEY